MVMSMVMDNKGLYPEMINDLNKMAVAFANEFNRVHASLEQILMVIMEHHFLKCNSTAGNLSVNQINN